MYIVWVRRDGLVGAANDRSVAAFIARVPTRATELAIVGTHDPDRWDHARAQIMRLRADLDCPVCDGRHWHDGCPVKKPSPKTLTHLRVVP